jgi:hypothetical protein
MESISEPLLELEKKLLDPVLRRSPQKLAPMLAVDFVEFGSSGRAYDKKQVLYALRKQLPGRLIIEEFRVREISPTAALVTYRARAESADHQTEKYPLRSSLWVRRGGDWQMAFHQGTLVSENRGF